MDQDKLNHMKNELQALHEKLAEMELEKEEFQVVLEALQTMSDTRKCFRQVNGTLIEQTVAQTKPFLQNHLSGIQSIIQNVSDQKTKKELEFKNFISTNIKSN